MPKELPSICDANHMDYQRNIFTLFPAPEKLRKIAFYFEIIYEI